MRKGGCLRSNPAEDVERSTRSEEKIATRNGQRGGNDRNGDRREMGI